MEKTQIGCAITEKKTVSMCYHGKKKTDRMCYQGENTFLVSFFFKMVRRFCMAHISHRR